MLLEVGGDQMWGNKTEVDMERSLISAAARLRSAADALAHHAPPSEYYDPVDPGPSENSSRDVSPASAVLKRHLPGPSLQAGCGEMSTQECDERLILMEYIKVKRVKRLERYPVQTLLFNFSQLGPPSSVVQLGPEEEGIMLFCIVHTGLADTHTRCTNSCALNNQLAADIRFCPKSGLSLLAPPPHSRVFPLTGTTQ